MQNLFSPAHGLLPLFPREWIMKEFTMCLFPHGSLWPSMHLHSRQKLIVLLLCAQPCAWCQESGNEWAGTTRSSWIL